MLVLEGNGLLDLVVFCTDPRILGIAMGVEFGNGAEAFLVTPVVDEPTGRFRKDHDQGSQEDCWNDLNSERNTPLCAVGAFNVVICAVRDPRCDESADTEHELLQRCNTSSDAGMCKLCLVRGDNHGEEA